VIHTLAENVNDAALADFVGEPGQELLAVDVLGVLVVADAEFLEVLRLRGVEEV